MNYYIIPADLLAKIIDELSYFQDYGADLQALEDLQNLKLLKTRSISENGKSVYTEVYSDLSGV